VEEVVSSIGVVVPGVSSSLQANTPRASVAPSASDSNRFLMVIMGDHYPGEVASIPPYPVLDAF
jgi:hypothetical protein